MGDSLCLQHEIKLKSRKKGESRVAVEKGGATLENSALALKRLPRPFTNGDSLFINQEDFMKHTTKALAVGTAILWSLPAAAIVNVEGMRVRQPEEGVSGNVDVSLGGKSGNTDKRELALDGRVQWHRDKVTDFVILSYDYGEANDIRNVNASLLHGRHVVQYLPRRAWEAFVQAEHDEFTRLSFRGLAGGGWRFTQTEEMGRLALHIGVGAFAVNETLEKRAGLSDDGSDNYARGNFYLAYKQQLNPQMSVSSTTYYQPRLDDFPDKRILEQAALAVKMTDRLNLTLSINIAHDSRPPQTVEKTDVSYNTSLSYKF